MKDKIMQNLTSGDDNNMLCSYTRKTFFFFKEEENFSPECDAMKLL